MKTVVKPHEGGVSCFGYLATTNTGSEKVGTYDYGYDGKVTSKFKVQASGRGNSTGKGIHAFPIQGKVTTPEPCDDEEK